MHHTLDQPARKESNAPKLFTISQGLTFLIYTVLKRVEKLRELTTKARLPIAFVGSAFDGVGLNDAIMSSKNEVCRLFP